MDTRGSGLLLSNPTHRNPVRSLINLINFITINFTNINTHFKIIKFNINFQAFNKYIYIKINILFLIINLQNNLIVTLRLSEVVW